MVKSAQLRFGSWPATVAIVVPMAVVVSIGLLFALNGSDSTTRVFGLLYLGIIGPLCIRHMTAPLRLTDSTLTVRLHWRYRTFPLAAIRGAGTGAVRTVLPWVGLRIDADSGPVVVGELSRLGSLGRRDVAAAADAVNRAVAAPTS